MKNAFSICVGLYGLLFFAWCIGAGNPFFYFFYEALPGQSLYLLAKCFGFLAICSLLVQIAIGIASATRILRESKVYHAVNALLSVGFATLHVLSFLVGASIRSDKPAWEVVIPQFTDYYHSMLGLGIVAFVLLLMMFALGALLRRRLQQSSLVRLLHYASPLVMIFATVHSFSIGSETRTVGYIVVFGCLILAILTILVFGLLSRTRPIQFSR